MPSKTVNRLFTLLIVFGILIACIGLGLDLIPGSNPGISAPQLIIILSGVGLSFIGWLLRNPNRRQKLMSISGQNILISVVTAVIMLVVLELMLVAVNIPIRYPAEIESLELTPLEYWVCDDLGCRYDSDVVQDYCADGRLSDIHCIINQAGFHDTDEFTADAVADHQGLKMLALGDSFTFGASAKVGSSWVETIEATVDNALIWNLGMPGTGNNQALTLLETYAPQLNPDVVILGFYLNDFEDNTYPLDQFYRGNINDQFAFIRQYSLASDGTPTRITNQTHLLYRFRGVEPPVNRIEETLGKTRLGSLLLNTIETSSRVYTSIEDGQFQYQIETTRNLLQSIDKTVKNNGGEFLILLIPDSADLQQPSRVYQTAIELFEELSIPYINPSSVLETRDYERQPGVHWLTSGHEVVGKMVSNCLMLFEEATAWQACDGLTINE